jgi:hypothetical protein
MRQRYSQRQQPHPTSIHHSSVLPVLSPSHVNKRFYNLSFLQIGGTEQGWRLSRVRPRR